MFHALYHVFGTVYLLSMSPYRIFPWCRLMTYFGCCLQVLPETSPYRTVCQLRPEDVTTASSDGDKKGSLITIQLTSRQAAKSPVGDRAPADGITTVSSEEYGHVLAGVLFGCAVHLCDSRHKIENG
jgi:hypothetical protein